jgi:hypothetical protein
MPRKSIYSRIDRLEFRRLERRSMGQQLKNLVESAKRDKVRFKAIPMRVLDANISRLDLLLKEATRVLPETRKKAEELRRELHKIRKQRMR